MNKKKGLLLVALFCLIISPYNVTAATYKTSKSTANGRLKLPSGEWLSEEQQNAACEKGLDIKIKASKYKSTSGVDQYEVKTRKITVETSGIGVYRVKIFTGDIGDLHNVKSLKDIDAEDYDDTGIKVKNKKIQKGEKKFEYDVEDGKEALVVVLSGNDVKDNIPLENVKYCKNSDCSETKSLTCRAGKIDNDSNTEDIVLSGNGAALFVQNPVHKYEMDNVNNRFKDGVGEACQKAYKGEYSKSNDTKEYDVDQAHLKDWRDNYYTPVLGEPYCDKNSVAFTIPNSKIEQISDLLLEIYKKHLDFSSSSSVQKDIEFKNTIKKIQAQMKELYAKRGETDIKSYIYKDASNLRVKLDCNYENKVSTAGERMNFYDIKENIYLYIDEGKSIKASITKNFNNEKKDVEVCSYKCYEKLTVRYDPPQAVRAGMCVTAKLTVESQTECVTEDKSSNIINTDLFKPAMCSPVPICENNAKKVQAGPNEKFDKCVNECDGGKYSQSCINKCYNKVYKKTVKKKVANTKTYGDVAKVTKLNNTKSNITVTKVANKKKRINECINKGDCDFNGDQMAQYYKNTELKNIVFGGNYGSKKEKTGINCTNDKLIKYVGDETKYKTELSFCARFFYTAKAFHPKGHYRTNENEKDMLDWRLDNVITNAGANVQPGKIGPKNNPSGNLSLKNVPMQIGRAAPFYTRSYTDTKELIKSMLKEDGPRKRIYNITGTGNNTSPGVKRQVRDNFVCTEECHFTGCSTEKNAMNANEYTDSIIEDLKEIRNRMKECSVKAACGKQEKISKFNIGVDGIVKTGKDGKEDYTFNKSSSGTTKIGTTNANTNNCAMFVKENDDDGDSKNGILGKCYDKTTNPPQYKTTIVYPHSWVNYKAKTTAYENPCKAPSEKCDEVKCKKDLTLGRTSCYFENKDPSCEFEYFGSQYCVRFDSEDINTKWGDWVYKYDSTDRKYLKTDDYPKDFTPTWNINGEAKDFGEYKWNVTFRCFYAVTSNTTTPPEETSKKSVCDCEKDKSCCAKVTNYSFKVLDVEKPFYKGSSSTNSNTSDRYKTLGYNFRSEATITGIDTKTANASAKTYAINPKKYLTKVLDSSEGKDVYKSTSYDYHIILKKADLKQIKRDNKNSTYTSFRDGEWRDYTGIKGFKSYWSNFVTKYDKGSKRQQIKGKNNDYNNVDELLGEGE